MVSWWKNDNVMVKVSSNFNFFFFHYQTKKKTCNGTLPGRPPPLPLNKHVNRWFNRWESLHLLGQRRDPLCSESAPSCQHSSSGAWDCCLCYEHTETKCSLGEVGQQSRYATEPRNHGTTDPLHARKTNSWTILRSQNASWTWLWKWEVLWTEFQSSILMSEC